MNLSAYLRTGLLAALAGSVGCKWQSKSEEPEKTLADPFVKAEAKAMECMVCHGTKEAQRGPILDGMEVWYLTEQMEKFRAGIRGNRPSNRSEHLMGVGARKIESDLELAYLADWFANRPPVPAIRTVKGEVEPASVVRRLPEPSVVPVWAMVMPAVSLSDVLSVVVAVSVPA